MNADLIRLSMRQQFNPGRLFLLALLAGLPVLIAVAYAAFDPNDTPQRFTSRMLDGVVLVAVLPLVALMIGAGALGNEVQDGTIPYLLLKPLRRFDIVASKWFVAALSSFAIVGPAVLISALVALGETDDQRIAVAFVVATLVGSLAYSAFFVYLSLLTTRAFIVGLLYIFIWEGVVTAIFPGVRYVSIRHYTRAIADAIANQPEHVFDADLSAVTGLVAAGLVTALSIWLATRRLEGFEVRERPG
jgi:ABC-2 type transport system permease protein